MPKSHSELVITGPEWKGLCEIISIVLGNDDLFRESGKTLLWNRGQVDADYYSPTGIFVNDKAFRGRTLERK